MWARVGDEWWCHPKVMGLGLAPRGLWISALSWSCHQRKSVVPWTLLAMLGADESHAAELVDAGLWKPCGDGWEIHDWAEYQDMSTSEKRALAGAKGGKASGAARRSKAKQTDAVTSGNVEAGEASAEAGTHPFPTLPKQRARDPLARPRLAEFVPPPAEPIAPPPADIRSRLTPAPREASA